MEAKLESQAEAHREEVAQVSQLPSRVLRSARSPGSTRLFHNAVAAPSAQEPPIPRSVVLTPAQRPLPPSCLAKHTAAGSAPPSLHCRRWAVSCGRPRTPCGPPRKGCAPPPPGRRQTGDGTPGQGRRDSRPRPLPLPVQVAREGELEAEIAALKRALQEKETAVELVCPHSNTLVLRPLTFLGFGCEIFCLPSSLSPVVLKAQSSIFLHNGVGQGGIFSRAKCFPGNSFLPPMCSTVCYMTESQA